MKKTIGIIGGMGPLATCDIMEKIIALTNADTDQENIHLVVDCNTNIPDRTAAILNNGESPIPQLVRSGVKLQGMGADVLIMPCNTAHFFYKDIVPYFDIPLLNMLEETAAYLKKHSIVRVGLLATNGTIQSEVYHRILEKNNIEVLTPKPEEQDAVMGIIYHGVKAGNKVFKTDEFCKVMNMLLKRGAQRLILGCTELPVAVEMYHLDYPTVDPTKVLAEAAIRYCQ